MTLFWISTCVVVLVSLFFVIFPMIQRSSLDRQLQRDELNKAFYKNRLSELEEENNEGLVDNQEELVEELKQSLLDDIPEKKSLVMLLVVHGRFFCCLLYLSLPYLTVYTLNLVPLVVSMIGKKSVIAYLNYRKNYCHLKAQFLPIKKCKTSLWHFVRGFTTVHRMRRAGCF